MPEHIQRLRDLSVALDSYSGPSLTPSTIAVAMRTLAEQMEEELTPPI